MGKEKKKKKKKMPVTSIFSFSHNVFYVFEEKLHHFSKQFKSMQMYAFNLDETKVLLSDKGVKGNSFKVILFEKLT